MKRITVTQERAIFKWITSVKIKVPRVLVTTRLIKEPWAGFSGSVL